MSPGAVIAAGVWSAFALLLIYGLSFDVRRWLKDRRQGREIRRALHELERAWEQPAVVPLHELRGRR